MVVEDDGQAAKVREERHRLPALETVIVMDLGAQGVQTGERSLAEVVDRGHQRLMTENGLGRVYKERSQAIDPDALATIVYTSRHHRAPQRGHALASQPRGRTWSMSTR